MVWLLVLLSVGAIVYGIIRCKKEENDAGSFLSLAFGVVATLFLLIFLPIQTLDNGSRVAEMEVFLESNTQNYQYSIDETASYLSVDSIKENVLIEGSIEKLQQAGYVSERIKEWRDSVNEYNTRLASFKYYDSNIFMGVLIPDKVKDMKFLVIK